MTYLIIDDEPIAHRIIEGYCAELPHLEKAGNAYNGFEASAILSRQTVELIFLDINMPKLTGFEWLKTLPQNPKVIVTTAYSEYALEGYELDIVDYLLKPFSFARFLKAVNKALSNQDMVTTPVVIGKTTGGERFFLKGDKKYHQIRTEDILYVEAQGNYCKVVLQTETIFAHEKISSVEQLLPADAFLRIHKSFIVAKEQINQIEGNRMLISDHKIPIGQTYRSRVNRFIKGDG